MGRTRQGSSAHCDAGSSLQHPPIYFVNGAPRIWDTGLGVCCGRDQRHTFYEGVRLFHPVHCGRFFFCRVCCRGYYFCAVGCAEMAAHALCGQLVGYGAEETNNETAMRGLRYSVLHNSLLEHLKLIDAIAVQILALVSSHEHLTTSRRTSATKLEVPAGDRVSVASSPRGERTGPAPNVSIRAEIHSVVTAAQYTISATHVRLRSSPLAGFPNLNKTGLP